MYQQSNISLTRDLANKYSEWNTTTIARRVKELSKEALEIWKFPKQVSETEKSFVTGEHYLDEDVTITGLKQKAL